MLGTQACLFDGRDRYSCFPPRKLGTAAVNKLMSFTICRARPHMNPPDSYTSLRFAHPRLFPWALFLSQEYPSLGRCHVKVVTWWPLHCLYDWDHTCSSGNISCLRLYLCTWDQDNCYQKTFFQSCAVLKCLKINYPMLGSRSLNQHWGSSAEPDFLLASHKSFLCQRCTGCKNATHVILPASPVVMTPSATLPAKADNGWAPSALAASPNQPFSSQASRGCGAGLYNMAVETYFILFTVFLWVTSLINGFHLFLPFTRFASTEHQ